MIKLGFEPRANSPCTSVYCFLCPSRLLWFPPIRKQKHNHWNRMSFFIWNSLLSEGDILVTMTSLSDSALTQRVTLEEMRRGTQELTSVVPSPTDNANPRITKATFRPPRSTHPFDLYPCYCERKWRTDSTLIALQFNEPGFESWLCHLLASHSQPQFPHL